jgi:aminoglycoside phosphotransferase (APT) family kinase protein
VPVREITDGDVAARASAVADRTWPGATVREVRRLEGGVSSLTYAARLERPSGRQDVVLKLAPPGLEPVRNRDVLRQARVLDRLAGLDGFPVPRVVVRDAGDPPDVPPMFAMELRPGQAYEPLLDVSDHPPSAEDVVAREHALARALARFQSPAREDLGVADEPVASVGEELARWQRLLATVDPDIAVGHERLAARLAQHVPADITPRLVHGDYRAANALFAGPELEAVIDWEIWSVGDPRLDLAWLLMHTQPAHVFHADRSPADLEAGRLMPTAAELLATYVDARTGLGATDAEVAELTSDLAWFLAVSHYKVASTIAVIWKRERKRSEPDAKVTVAAERLDLVLAAGHAALDQLD